MTDDDRAYLNQSLEILTTEGYEEGSHISGPQHVEHAPPRTHVEHPPTCACVQHLHSSPRDDSPIASIDQLIEPDMP